MSWYVSSSVTANGFAFAGIAQRDALAEVVVAILVADIDGVRCQPHVGIGRADAGVLKRVNDGAVAAGDQFKTGMAMPDDVHKMHLDHQIFSLFYFHFLRLSISAPDNAGLVSRGKNVLKSDAMNTTLTFEQRYVQARRRFIAADFANLNDMQRKAVLATEGPLLLLAGAGSGKTTVLIHRIANLIQYGRGSDTDEVPETATEADLALLERTDLTPEERRRAQWAAAVEPVEPWRIIAITFTNKAADELKDRIERMLGPEAAADIWASTFHSACVRILRRDADKLGYPNSFTIYDTSDSQSVVKRILKEMNLDEKAFPYRAVLTEISRAKDAGITPEQYLARAQATHNPRSIRIGEVYQTYWQRLFSAGAMDFDDLIYNTVRLLDEHEDVREHWQRRFRYVLIDEYQDTNNLQYRLAALLADGWGNICVVGDDDQSIYKFQAVRRSRTSSTLKSSIKNARTIRLEQNYRSTGRILDAANHVIANNTGRKGKTLWTKAEAGDPLTLYCATNENDEARYVATKIMDDFGHGMNFRDHAVLYRMNAQSNQLEYAFKRNGIPYRIIGGTRFFDRAEVKDMLAYLCVIQTPDDDLRLTRIINTPARGIGARARSKRPHSSQTRSRQASLTLSATRMPIPSCSAARCVCASLPS